MLTFAASVVYVWIAAMLEGYSFGDSVMGICERGGGGMAAVTVLSLLPEPNRAAQVVLMCEAQGSSVAASGSLCWHASLAEQAGMHNSCAT